MNDLLQQFTKFIKSNQKTDPYFANLSHFGDFAGMNLSLLNSLKNGRFDNDTWILDTGATTDMCSKLSSINQFAPVTKYTPIFLRDSSIKSVTHTGSVILNSRLILEKVLHVPEFTCNLLSVKALAASANIAFTFYPTHDVLQDLQTAKIVAYGKVIGGLYVLDNNSLISNSVPHFCKKFQTCNAAHVSNKESYFVWHKRLGHSSESTPNHLKFIPAKTENEGLPCILVIKLNNKDFHFQIVSLLLIKLSFSFMLTYGDL